MVSVNRQIKHYYLHRIVPVIAKNTTVSAINGTGSEGSADGMYVEAGARDVESLTAMSRRIHCGKSSSPRVHAERILKVLPLVGMLVSESKFRSTPATFVPLILAQNSTAIGTLITVASVEAALYGSLAEKARGYGLGQRNTCNGTTPIVDETQVSVQGVSRARASRVGHV